MMALLFRYKRFAKANGLDRTVFAWVMKERIPKDCADMAYDLFDNDHNGTLDIFEFSKMIGSNFISSFLTISFSFKQFFMGVRLI